MMTNGAEAKTNPTKSTFTVTARTGYDAAKTAAAGAEFLAAFQAKNRGLLRRLAKQYRDSAPRVVARARLPEVLAKFGVPDRALDDGYFTVVFDGATDAPKHYTFRVVTNSAKDKFLPGKQLIELLVGQNNERDYRSVAYAPSLYNRPGLFKDTAANLELSDAVSALVDGAEDAGRAYVLHSGCCRRCGRRLTRPEGIDPQSPQYGYGPDCFDKLFG